MKTVKDKIIDFTIITMLAIVSIAMIFGLFGILTLFWFVVFKQIGVI